MMKHASTCLSQYTVEAQRPKRLFVAKGTSSKKVLFVIFLVALLFRYPVLLVLLSQDIVQAFCVKKVKKNYEKKRPSKGWSGVRLMKSSSHKSKLLRHF